LSTGGKCRYCHKKIGWFEPAMELGMAALFVGLYLLWPYHLSSIYDVTQFILWLVAGVLLAILFAYDLKWYLLPNYIVFPLIGVGVIFAVLMVIGATDTATALFDIVFSAIILSGIYFVLWLVSKGQWIGFGDVKLGLALALLLADWKLAFIALFAANFIGCLIVIPGMLAKKIDRKTRVPFGPLLIAGTVLAMLVGRYVIDWYFISFI
jgi:leader peptidase (prepilin peptidase)/N-methyltransferase